ncbi:stealth conserved region 3 domain-containing protein [Frigoribacterium sp. CFBP9039]|uniref:stealth conserved region 3 domain-containing protein n=1 Tax=Frigoribacterium TaxID=96492 RepID=UPI0017848D8B|nr:MULTISPECIES: stealth conserved region 3 domain-containing protein [Frigoribacterium]MBD8702211.1 stealth conserved region 3 domain-containing protein [Frigoribacterium sp. CFBP 13712]MCJ0701336.1 stealth conserved region 3 domain-containing protein [Frigoribacterium faeni]MDY0946974.1 stealth conserved region 3 domain-containing protein [Frigoribacterium sp. CFBP9039]
MVTEITGTTESPLLTPRPRSGGLDRDDIVLRKGQFTLLNGHLTPQQSMIEDLLYLRRVLDEADVPYLLVRGNDIRPVIAIDIVHREAFVTAMVEASASEPFYAKAGKSRAVLVVEGGLDVEAERIFKIYRPRVEPIGRLRYGAGTAVQVEFWIVTDDEILAPTENALMRTALPRDEAVEGTVERFGLEWPTLAHMFDDHATDITFEIDLIFSWVDGNSVEYQRARAAQAKRHVVGEGDDAPARFRQIDELKYALRSVYMFAPWVRTIYIATDSPVPEWLGDHPRVRVVRSEEFFSDLSYLPTHNSQAVESQLHHIEGLSEHFLYSNDDMFFGRPVAPSMFFSPGSVTKFIEADTRIGLGLNNPERSGFENAARVNRRLLQQRFGRVTTRHLEHTAAPLRRSVMYELEHEFAAEFAATAASPFRAKENISVTNSLYHYYSLMTGRAIVQENARVSYIDTTMVSGLASLSDLLKKRSDDFFCLNDGSFPEVSDEERTATVTDFLERYYPFAAPWEQAEMDRVARESAEQDRRSLRAGGVQGSLEG